MVVGWISRWAGAARKYLVPVAISICSLVVASHLALAQTSPSNDALLRAIQRQTGGGDDNSASPTPSGNQIIQPAALPPAKEAPPSQLEQTYATRAGSALRQFGYDVVGVPAPLNVIQSGAVPGNYVLGVGDEIVFVLRGQENSTYRQRISRDGQVILPKLSPITAAGRTFSEFKADVEARVAQSFLSTNVFVSLGETRQLQVLVSGDVRVPGTRVVNGLASPLDAILLSGGVAKTGSLRNVQLIRDGRVQHIDLYSVLSQSSRSNLGFLRDGDRIYVPPIGPTVAVAGTVGTPGIFELTPGSIGIRADALIRLAGGFRIAGAYTISLVQLTSRGELKLVPATPGTIVHSGEVLSISAPVTKVADRVDVRGSVSGAGTKLLPPNHMASGLISVRDISPTAYTLAAIIVRRDQGSGAIELVPFPLVDVLKGRSDVAMQSDDVVYIFSRDEMRALLALAIDNPQHVAEIVGTSNRTVVHNATGAFQRQGNTSSPSPQSNLAPGANQVGLVPVPDSPVDPVDDAIRKKKEKDAEDARLRNFQAGALNLAPGDNQNFSDEELADGVGKTLGVSTTSLVRTVRDRLVWVLDEVRSPGPYFASAGTPMDEVLDAAGGPLGAADLSALEVTSTVINQGAGVSSSSRAFYRLADLGGVTVHALDIMRVRAVISDRQSGMVKVSGAVRYPGAFDILRQERLSSVLERAGGLSEDAYPYGAVFTRLSAADAERVGNDREARSIEAQATLINRGSEQQGDPAQALKFLLDIATRLRETPVLGRITVTADPAVLAIKPELDILMEPGDSIFVPKRPSTITVSGEVLSPGSLQFHRGWNMQDYLRQAGGYTQDADSGRTFIVLPDGSATTQDSDWLNFGDRNIPPGSTIVVPRDLRPFDWRSFLKDVTQIVSQLAVAAASLAVLRTNN